MGVGSVRGVGWEVGLARVIGLGVGLVGGAWSRVGAVEAAALDVPA